MRLTSDGNLQGMAIARREREQSNAARPESSARTAGSKGGSGQELKTLKQRYAAVKQRIDAAAQRAGRSGKRVVLVAVTKYAAIDQVRELLELGHVDLGESHVQNLVQRRPSPITCDDGIAAQRIALAARRSAEQAAILPVQQ